MAKRGNILGGVFELSSPGLVFFLTLTTRSTSMLTMANQRGANELFVDLGVGQVVDKEACFIPGSTARKIRPGTKRVRLNCVHELDCCIFVYTDGCTRQTVCGRESGQSGWFNKR